MAKSLRNRLRGSLLTLREGAIKCLEAALDTIARPIKYLDELLRKFGPSYTENSQAEPEAQANEVREAAVEVVRAATDVLVEGVSAVMSAAKAAAHAQPIKILKNTNFLNALLASGVAGLWEWLGWLPPVEVTMPLWMSDFVLALFITGLLVLAVKKAKAFTKACRVMGGALLRLLRALVAFGGWWTVRKSAPKPFLLTHMRLA